MQVKQRIGRLADYPLLINDIAIPRQEPLRPGLSCFSLNQYRGDNFVYGFREGSRLSFFTFIHLFYQKAYRLVGDLIDLLSHSAYGNDSL